MIKRYAFSIAALSLGVAVSATGALAQTYVAPGGSPTATAPGGLEGRTGASARSFYDDATTGSVIGRPSAYDASDARSEVVQDGSRAVRRAR